MFIEGWTDKDGNSITHKPLGFFINPDESGEWSSKPYNKEQRQADVAYRKQTRALDRIKEHLSRTDRSILEELELVRTGKSTLPRYAKDFLIKLKIN